MSLVVFLFVLFLQWYQLTSQETRESPVTKKGICLWSHGRSGSGTISQTFKNSISVDFCKHVKEGFRFQYPRLKFLRRCLQGRESSPPLRFTHVKPRHVTHSDRQVAASFSEKVSLVQQFMSNLKEAGFGALLVHRRQNTLAMLISDFELKYKRRLVLYSAFEEEFRDVVRILQYNHEILEEGYRHALLVGLPVVETNFSAMTGEQSCGEFTRIFRFLNNHNFSISRNLVNNCVKQVNAHLTSAKPRRNSSLEMRVGNITAARITKALTNTPYEWMLDLSAKDWPAGARNPCWEKGACRFVGDEGTGLLVSA